MKPKDPHIQTACQRCGTCCRKGGPTLHLEDRYLVEKGIIPLNSLVTFRKGEVVRDDIQNRFITLPNEIIKVKGQSDSWTCTYFNSLNQACRIYANRPVECRKLECWNTGRLEAMYTQDRLSRHDLLSDIEGLWDLIVDHEKRCAYQKVARLVELAKGGRLAEIEGQFVKLLAYDAHIRELMIDKGMGAVADKIDFLFGRPLTQTLAAFGLQARQQAGRLVIMPFG